MSSAYFPQSKGRAEVAVKTVKRLLMANLSTNRDLNNDCFLCAILQLRNTPDFDCGICIAEVVFGHPLLHAFSFVNRLEKFSNRCIRRVWRETLRAEEDALRLRAGRNNGALSKTTRTLRPFSFGDCVFIQNQKGNHPRKWNKVGTVVEVSKYDPSAIKILGSGLLTTRNRRFLRLIPAPDKPHDPGSFGVHVLPPKQRLSSFISAIQKFPPSRQLTQTPVGEQGENQLPHGPLPASFRNLSPNFSNFRRSRTTLS